jgi:hypothetical protein
VWPGAYTYCRNRYRFCDPLRSLDRDSFNDDRKCACLLNGDCISNETLDIRFGPRLHLVSSNLEKRLGRQTQMAHHRDTNAYELFDQVEVGSFQFYSVDTPFLYQAAGIADSVFNTVVGTEWQITNDERELYASDYHLTVINHGFQRDWNCCVVALHENSECVSDRQDGDAGGVERTCHGIVVSSQNREWFAALLESLKVMNGYVVPHGFGH